MKFFIWTLIMSATCACTYAQDFQLNKDTLTTPKGYKLFMGEEIKFGNGTLPDGRFKYITVNPKNKYDSTNHSFIGLDEDALPKAWKDHKKAIKGFKNVKDYLTAKISVGLSSYYIDIESAMESGEVIVPGYETAQTNPLPAPTQKENASSVVDDLKKLGELHDKGILTDDEFKRAKEKLLNK